ncbi:MAG: hypothetical protein HC832_03120 [Leptolyngbyaceae cyanobacterium RM1_405_57]|nr:hypothetical protein [Leptolyngbyaceae cyanobacterium RM1_405_57]
MAMDANLDTATNGNNVTSVQLGDRLVNTLDLFGIQTTGFGDRTIDADTAQFQITGGAVDLDNTRLEVIHSGGLTFQVGQTAVNLTDFIISNLNDQTVLTGLVSINRNLLARVPLFALQGGEISALENEGITTLNLSDVDVRLAPFSGIVSFLSGLRIGTAQVNAQVDSQTEDVLGMTTATGSDAIGSSPVGTTSVTFSTALVDALGALGVQASGFGETGIEDGVATFAITGGAADLNDTQVEIIHTGGLTFSTANTTVNLTDFVISNLGERPNLTGLVTVNGELLARLPLFNLNIGEIGSTSADNLVNLDLQNVQVTLTDTAAGALNQAFTVNAFQPDFAIGTALVDAFINPETGDMLGIPASAPQQGTTSVTLSNDLVNALGSLNVQASGFGGSEIENGTVAFAITGGEADLNDTQIELIHAGGLTLQAGDTTVTLTDFVISNLGDRPALTGLVSVNGDTVTRATLFDLQLNDVAASTSNDLTNLDLGNVGVTLNEGAAAVLNQVFGVTDFAGGLNIGTAQVDAFIETITGDVRGVADPILPIHSAADSASQLDVTQSGDTSVTLSDDLLNALTTLGVAAAGLGGTQINSGVADFLITGGIADLADTQVEIIHSGGLSLRTASTMVNLTDFVISNVDGSAVLTGLVSVNGDLLTRASLFDLAVSDIEVSNAAGSSTNLELNGVGVRLTNDAADLLNQVFGVTAFTGGFNMGTAQVDAFLA